MWPEELVSLYDKYLNELKPLVAEYEARNENFVASLLNDLPVMFDNVVLFNVDGANKKKYLDKANECLNNSINTLKHYLTASMMENVTLFQSRYPKEFLMTLNRGQFYGEFEELETDVRCYKKTNPEKAYNSLRRMEEMINTCDLDVLTKNFIFDNKRTTIFKWVITILSSLVVNYIILMLF